MRSETVKCPKCGRILFPTKDNRLPHHKVPEPFGMTGPGRPWCNQKVQMP